ncbi:uncharacterized protein L969DRAFT_78185 [Mixia osmundae IAM 14324]|uniref:Integral membrane protein n=1 Tax=Mixia osmundae (strain CBS 9802 / IAM 14324 / JCM 22182 / KY 12970) TaxID=764103 RepID=G7E528_MIXOS|nr:uncharacterized protein L969DRAFT_78185 [Mixia osmundae IAM 14324]KEI37800.1 hypothetical protein L969DRAFT_78185 [Mixia osmundae IAM 14324]GAA97938.1 hypothetical protein E5Q_04618 [Mixia osmundae IAM 14324]
MATQTPAKLNPALAWYLGHLAARPLFTKACTAGTLSFFQEIIAGRLAGVPPVKVKRTGLPPLDILRANERAVKLAIYGFLISAPLGHALLNALQKAFAGVEGAKGKIGMILASNIVVSPIQNSVYLAAMAVINGASSPDAVLRFVKVAFLPLMRISWVVSPLCLVIAQRFLPPETWVPFFNAVSFVLGCFFNAQAKKKQMAMLRREQAKKNVTDRKGQ